MPEVGRLIAAHGVTFSHAVVSTSLCCASRASLLTGRQAHETGIWDNARHGGWARFRATGAELDTLPVHLSAAGYRTGLFGKYLNGFDAAPVGYVPPGWSRFLALRSQNGAYSHYETSDGAFHARYSTDFFARRAAAFVRSTPARTPVFAVFAPYAPHYPYSPGPYRGEARKRGLVDDFRRAGRLSNPSVLEPSLSDKPAWVRSYSHESPFGSVADTRRIARRQADALMGVDAGVARLLDALRQVGRAEDTLLIYLSDNGYSWGDHYLYDKNTPYGYATDVPLTISWPGHLDGGARDDRLVATIDVTATIAASARLHWPLPGRSLVAAPDRAGVVLEAPADENLHRPAYCGYLTHGWRYTKYSDGIEELYRLTADPWELKNVATLRRWGDPLRTLRDLARQRCDPHPPGFTW
jgi:N-acetylglucosamine-6-sulfatase